MTQMSVDVSPPPGDRRRRPTMRDVAELAGVSLKTVSRVVNEETGVSPVLTQRVRQAVDELGFRPHSVASNLRWAAGTTATVGLLLQDVGNPFSSALQRAIEDVALPRGVMVLSASLDESGQREHDLVHAFLGRRVDGLVIAPTGADLGHLEPDLRAGTAVVCVDRVAPGLPVDSVVTTNRLGAAEGVRHLAAGGHTRIAFLSDRVGLYTADERRAGYLEGLAEVGIAPDPSLVLGDLADPTLADGAVTRLLALPDPPTALFTAQNLVTIGALRALRRMGAETSVALLGFDDFPLADLLRPAVSVVAQDPAAIGRTAANLLFRRLAGDVTPPTVHVVPTTLVRRGSGEVPPP